MSTGNEKAAAAKAEEKPVADKPVTVQATAKGFYGSIRRPGAIFTIKSEAHFSDKWMDVYEAPAPERKSGKGGDA